MANPSSKTKDRAWDDPAFGESASNASGTRRVTHEIDSEFGVGRAAAEAADVERWLNPSRSHTPTLRPPTLRPPTVRAQLVGVAAPRPRASRPKLPPMLQPWESDSQALLLSEASWLGATVRSLAESTAYPAADEVQIATDESHLSHDELAAALAEASDVSIEVEEASLALEDLEAIDDSDLAPVRAAFERGDYLGVVASGEALLAQRPTMRAALHYVAVARETLARDHLDWLATCHEVPHARVTSLEIMSLSLDHREAFLLSMVDGVATLEEIVDMSGMPAADALRLFNVLVARRLVSVRR